MDTMVACLGRSFELVERGRGYFADKLICALPCRSRVFRRVSGVRRTGDFPAGAANGDGLGWSEALSGHRG